MEKNNTSFIREEYQIAQRFDTLAEAVEASNIDLSYNPFLAKQRIKETDEAVGEAFLTVDGDIYYTYICDIKVFHKFDPFISSIDNSDFELVTVLDNTITYTGFYLPKNRKSRKVLANVPDYTFVG